MNKMTDPDMRFRNLNDYESMLASSTCIIALKLSVTCSEGAAAVSELLRQAWARSVQERCMLQVRLVERQDDTGPLGCRYAVAPIEKHKEEDLFVVRHVSSDACAADVVRDLQRLGTSALDISKGSYHVDCEVSSSDNEPELQIRVIMSLCHALSDGPGALQVARSFLQHLGNVLDNERGSGNNTSKARSDLQFQPLLDLQSMLLGQDYGAGQEQQSVFRGQEEYCNASQANDISNTLAPEALQAIPSDAATSTTTGVIDCLHFTLSSEETSRLRTVCRKHGTTVQGILTAAALFTRATLLDLWSKSNGPVFAAAQTPVNTQSLVKSKSPVDDSHCLCGSAGVWHSVQIEPDEKALWTCAKDSSDAVRTAIQQDQPREWLRRLFHAPSTLSPYSLMVSSIGVAPVDETYGRSLSVDKLFFFGGSLHSSVHAKATMVHAVTFRNEMTCMINFTSPGVARSFAADTAKHMKATLLSIMEDC